MTTLRLFTHIGKNVRTTVFQQVTHQKNACTLSHERIFGINPNSLNGVYRSASQMVAFVGNPEFGVEAKRNYVSRRQLHYYTNLHCDVGTTLPLVRTKPLIVTDILNHRRYISNKASPDHAGKTETKSSAAITNDEIFAESSKLGLFARFKLMYKKYWYVLIPVHIVTSIGWFGAFYYLSQSGVDVPTLLHQLHVSDTIIEKMKNSSMGHLAIAYICYKVATPLRYAVTLGGTTVSIKYLVQAGYIKPMPSKQELMDMYEQKKADLTKDKEK